MVKEIVLIGGMVPAACNRCPARQIVYMTFVCNKTLLPIGDDNATKRVGCQNAEVDQNSTTTNLLRQLRRP